MNESYERSYYEIALTNNQVLSAVAVLLLCLLASFVAGMWVARGASEPLTAQVAQEAGLADGDPAADGEAFRFFERRPSAPGADGEVRPVEANSAADTESVNSDASPDRVNRNVRPVEVASAEPVRPAPRTASPAQDSQARQPSQQPESRQPQQQKPEQQDPVATRPTQPTPSRPAPEAAPAAADTQRLGEMLVIQVLSSSDQSQAGAVSARLKESGYRSFLSPVVVEGRTMYRVRVGPYSDRAQAEVAEEKIKRTFQLDTWITARS